MDIPPGLPPKIDKIGQTSRDMTTNQARKIQHNETDNFGQMWSNSNIRERARLLAACPHIQSPDIAQYAVMKWPELPLQVQRYFRDTARVMAAYLISHGVMG